ncbi:MAG: hypothetical protein QOH24_681 [Verrucomicrobiota bacterium]|jgi:hypothetical protein
MYRSLKHLIGGGVFFILVSGTASLNAEPPGSLEGHLKILSLKEVELAETSPSKQTTENYAEYPLIVLSKVSQKEVARVTADQDGNYRVVLPPGDYILDVQGRKPKGHLRAKPQSFTVASNQTARVDMNIDTGIR